MASPLPSRPTLDLADSPPGSQRAPQPTSPPSACTPGGWAEYEREHSLWLASQPLWVAWLDAVRSAAYLAPSAPTDESTPRLPSAAPFRWQPPTSHPHPTPPPPARAHRPCFPPGGMRTACPAPRTATRCRSIGGPRDAPARRRCASSCCSWPSRGFSSFSACPTTHPRCSRCRRGFSLRAPPWASPCRRWRRRRKRELRSSSFFSATSGACSSSQRRE